MLLNIIIIITFIIVTYLIFMIFYLHILTKKKLVLKSKEDKEIVILKDQVYKKAGNKEFLFDIYTPKNEDKSFRSPCVIFIHGDGPDFFIGNAKDWRLFQDYGRLTTSSGFSGVTFNHINSNFGKKGSAAEKDIRNIVDFVRNHAHEYRIDPDRIFLWVFSAGAASGLSWVLKENPGYIKGVISYYGLLKSDNPDFSPLNILKEYDSSKTGKLPPFFIVKAEHDSLKTIKDSNEKFYSLVVEKGCDVTFIRHKTGRHAFDAFDDNEESRKIILKTLDFIQQACRLTR